MRKFVLITLAVVIFVLLFRNTAAVKQIITSATALFRQSFDAVTEVGEFK